ncbi:DsbA family protein [Acinetobacter nematophilus]|uniref:DsbA family protein n=1 Tax=Acinetobacter nematophilus TaxID=2994642 RepID=UPI003AF4AFDD
MLNCNFETGVCSIDAQKNTTMTAKTVHQDVTIRYIGDPMCSWCWGISPTITDISDYCKEHGLNFEIHVGGLRVGGGDVWNEKFKSFLRKEWEHIGQKTGQPYSNKILERSYFNYDTEPACRAIVTAKKMLSENKEVLVKFYSAVQFKFYVEGQDPKNVSYYQDICELTGLSFDKFKDLFLSPTLKNATMQEFLKCQQFGVRSFPSIVLDDKGKITPLSIGFSKTEDILNKLEMHLSK